IRPLLSFGIAGHAEADDVGGAFAAVDAAQAFAGRGARQARVPGVAADAALRRRAGSGRVAQAHVAVVFGVVAVPAPFGDVAVHVVKAPRVGLFLADGVGAVVGVLRKPGVVPQVVGVLAEVPARLRAGPAGVLPFRLGRQAVALAPLDCHELFRQVDLVIARQAVGLAVLVSEANP